MPRASLTVVIEWRLTTSKLKMVFIFIFQFTSGIHTQCQVTWYIFPFSWGYLYLYRDIYQLVEMICNDAEPS